MGQGFPTKLEYSNNGLQCIGPGFVVNGLISEFCPNNVTISFETARLIMQRRSTAGVEYIRGSGTRQITTWSFDVSRP